VDCRKKLNGMFAFCICDLRGGVPQLFLARDHFRIKPLYYVHRGRPFAFASEAKALILKSALRRRAIETAVRAENYSGDRIYSPSLPPAKP